MKKSLLFGTLIMAIALLSCWALVTADVAQKRTGEVVIPRSAVPLEKAASATEKTANIEKALPQEKVKRESPDALTNETEVFVPMPAPKVVEEAAALTLVKDPTSGAKSKSRMKKEYIEELCQRIQELKDRDLYDAALWDEYSRLTSSHQHRSGAHLDQGGEDCANATVVDALPYADNGTLGDTDDCDGRPYNDVFYVFTVPSTNSYTFDMCGSDSDTYLRIFTDDSCCSETFVAANDECGGLDPMTTIALSQDQVVYIECGRYSSTTTPGAYHFNITPAEDCEPDFTVVLDCSTGYSTTGNTCGAGNDCFTRGSEDHIYEIVVPEDRQYAFTLCNSSGGPGSWDSYMYLDSVCCGSDHIASDDDGCDIVYGLSDIDCYYLTAGTHYLLIEGYDASDCGEYQLDIVCCEMCSLDCPPGGIAEGEPICHDDYDDQYNGGCNTEPTPVFQSIAYDDAICGTSGTFIFGSSNYREMDWFELVVTERDSVIWSAVAEFNFRLWIVDGNYGCDAPLTIATQAGEDCDTIYVAACLNPGVYWFLIAPNAFDGIPCGVEYVAWLTHQSCLTQPPECPENTSFGQVVSLPTEPWTAGVSDLRTGSGYDPLIRYESFSGVTSPTCEIHFWGLSLSYPWTPCDENPMTLEIKFYQDAGGVPGTEMCSYTVTASRQGTGLTYIDYPLFYYSVILDSCCYIAEGWVSIQGISIGAPDCWFLWMSSGEGDGYSLLWNGATMSEESYDLSLCLAGDGELIGACCEPYTGTCTDDVTAANCQDLFYANRICAELEVPCGYGACCVDTTGECSLTTYADCQDPGFTWHPGVSCDPNPCPLPCPYTNRDFESDNNVCPPTNPECYVVCEDTLCGDVEVSGDEDYYEFVIEDGESDQLIIDVFGDATPGYWTYGQGLDPQIRVYNEYCVQIYYNDDGGEGYDSYIETDVLGAGTYYVHVKGYSNSTGPYILSVHCVEGAPDCEEWTLCCDPTETEPNDVCDSEVDAHLIDCEAQICGKVCPDSEEDIFLIVVPPQSVMTLDLYDGMACDIQPTTCIANNLMDENCAIVGSENTSGWQLTNELDETWYLYLDIYQTSPGCWATYRIVTECCDLVDYCENPIIVPNVYHYENTANTCCGTDPVPIVWSEYDCSGNDYTSGNDVVYKISIGSAGILDIVTSSPGDNQVMVFIDCADPTNTCVGSADNTLSGDDEEILGLNIPAGSYYISTSLWSIACGEMTLVIDSDVPLTAEVLTETPLPTEYALAQNFPNPFNPNTNIAYALKEGGFVTLKVFNILGQEVATLVEQKLQAGRYEANFMAENLPSGVYVYRLEVNSFTATQKMLLLK